MAREYRTYRTNVSKLLGTLGAGLLYCFMLTYRWRQVGTIPAELQEKKPLVFAFWHNQQLLMTRLFWDSKRGLFSRGLVALASSHRDGQIIARIVEFFGMTSIAGSSSRGAFAALLAMGRAVKEGYDIGIAPDGPRGPAMRVKPGALLLARKFSVSIIPVAYATKEGSSWRFKRAWDKMFLPKPFSRISWAMGAPLLFSKDHDLDAASAALEDALRSLNQAVITDVSN